MFSFKYSSLLQFNGDMRADAGTVRHNLRTLLGVNQAPCDAQMRVMLEPVEPSALRPAYRALHSAL